MWIKTPLLAKGGHWSMAGNEGNIVAKRKQALMDRGNQGVVIAAREVGTAYGSSE